MTVLYDRDRLSGKNHSSYLRRSASLLRGCMIRRRKGKSAGYIDPALLITRTGVAYVKRSTFKDMNGTLRKIGNYHLTKGFAEVFLSEYHLCSYAFKKQGCA